MKKKGGDRSSEVGFSKTSKKQVGFAVEPEKEQLLFTEENSPDRVPQGTDGSVISLNNRVSDEEA